MLQRLTFLLIALLLAASPLLAQTPPPAPPAATPDTAAALHRLFAERRHRSHVGLGVGGGALAASFILVGTANGYKDLGSVVFGALGVGVSAAGLVISLIHTVRYSKAHEQRTLLAWQRHRLPPRWSQRALRPAYTQPQP